METHGTKEGNGFEQYTKSKGTNFKCSLFSNIELVNYQRSNWGLISTFSKHWRGQEARRKNEIIFGNREIQSYRAHLISGLRLDQIYFILSQCSHNLDALLKINLIEK